MTNIKKKEKNEFNDAVEKIGRKELNGEEVKTMTRWRKQGRGREKYKAD